jgi:hypothetical protein
MSSDKEFQRGLQKKHEDEKDEKVGAYEDVKASTDRQNKRPTLREPLVLGEENHAQGDLPWRGEEVPLGASEPGGVPPSTVGTDQEPVDEAAPKHMPSPGRPSAGHDLPEPPKRPGHDLPEPPDRPGHDLPEPPKHPDHDLPEPPKRPNHDLPSQKPRPK